MLPITYVTYDQNIRVLIIYHQTSVSAGRGLLPVCCLTLTSFTHLDSKFIRKVKCKDLLVRW